MAEQTYSVKGIVVSKPTGTGAPGLRVEAWDKDLLFDDLLGSATTDQAGRFRIEFRSDAYREICFDRLPDVFFRVYKGEIILASTEHLVLWHVDRAEIEVSIPIDLPLAEGFLVQGLVRHPDGRAVVGATVKVLDKRLRSEVSLGEAATDAKGAYRIHYGGGTLQDKSQALAGLIVRAYDADGNELAASEVIFHPDLEETLDLVAGNAAYRGPSEYEQLVATLTPLLEGLSFADLTEDDAYRDISLLSGRSGEAPLLITMLAAAHRLARRTELAPEVFYGLLRSDLPPNLSALLAQDPGVVRRALEQAAADNLIPARFADGIDALLVRFRELAVTEAVRPREQGEQQPALVTLIGTVLADRDRQATFIRRYVEHSGPIEAFWDGLRDEPELAAQVDSLQFAVQSGALSGNHLALVRELQRMREQGEDVGGSSHRIETFRDLVYVDEPKWREIIQRDTGEGRIGVPTGTPGKDEEEQTRQYARTLSRIVERSFPTAYVAARLEHEDATGRDPVLAFLKSNVDSFEIDGMRLETYLAEHATALNDIAESDRPQVKQRLRAMQRVYRVAPRYEAMSALLKDGIDSAYAIVDMGREQFALRYGLHSPLDSMQTAYGVFPRAEQTHAMALAIATDHGIAGTHVSMNVINDQPASSDAARPDWQTLFGSLELCDCEHCRSVYSPAAYLVDLLHFLSGRKLIDPSLIVHNDYGYISKVSFLTNDATGADLTAKDILYQRRADLGQIELTCANTNTPLPYVDLVNEVMEDFIAPPPAFKWFDLPAELASQLDRREVSQALRDAFGKAFFGRDVLGTSIAVEVVKAGKHWRLHDAAYTYNIRTEEAGVPRVKTRGRQTSGSREELAANPRYLNRDAYRTLQKAVFPLTLPFDLWDAEAHTYLEHLGVKRHRLMEAFRPGTRAERLTDMAIVYAHLGLTTADAGLIVGSTTGQTGAPDSGVWNLWGFAKPTLDAKSAIPDPADSTAWLSKIEVPTQANPKSTSSAWLDILTGRVDVFLQQSGLTYKELLALLGTYCVNPLLIRGGRLITLVARPGEPEDTCETKGLRLVGMDQDAAMRALRFIRLWRKLGWSMQDLDRALTALGVNQSRGIKPTTELGATGDAPIGGTVLMKLSHIQRLHETLGIAIDRLLPFWGMIDSARYIDHDSADQTLFATLYERLFRNKRVINPPDPAFTEDPSKLTGKLSEHRATIAAALGLGAADLGLLLVDSDVLKQVGVPAVSDDTLSLENLSALYRHATLAKALSLSIRNYLIARGLAFDPFADTTASVLFVEQVQALTASNLTFVDLDYLSRHRILETDRVAPTDAEIARNLDALRTELASIANEHRFEDDKNAPGGPTVDSDGEITRSKLALLGWEAALIDRIVETLNDEVTYRTTLTSLPADPPDLSKLNDPGVYAVQVAAFPQDYAIPQALTGIVTYANGTLQSSRRLSTSELAAMLKAAETLKVEADKTAAEQAVNGLKLLQAQYGKDEYLGKVSYDATRKELSLIGVINDARLAKLKAASTDTAFKSAVEKLYNAPRTFLKRNLRTYRIHAFSAPLKALPQSIVFPAALRDRIFFVNDGAGHLTFVGAMTSEDLDTLHKLSTDAEYRAALETLHKAPLTSVIADPSDAFLTTSGIAELFSVHRSPAERFKDLLKGTLLIGGLLPHLRASLSARAVTQSLAEALNLETETANDLLTKWLRRPSQPKDALLSAFIDESFGACNPLVAISRSVFPDQFDAYVLLHKVALVISRFECTSRQARWLFTYASTAKWPDLSALPIVAPTKPAETLESWLRLVELFELRDGMPRGEEMLDDLLSRVAVPASGKTPEERDLSAATNQRRYMTALNGWTLWPDADLRILLGYPEKKPAKGALDCDFPGAYVGVALLGRLRDCFALLDRTGLSAANCAPLVAANVTDAAARAAREVARGKYNESQWLAVAPPLRNALRERQRTALVAYLVANPGKDHRWRKVSDVYGCFLLDVEMSPCQLTSRIKQANSSIQLFIQRCLMGLERYKGQQVLASAETDNRWREWRWMKNYRVWEANRKIFLYPENWIEPELRDDKTPFFKALEGELLQTNLTKDTAATAFRGYLEKLDAVARLEVVGMYHERSTDVLTNQVAVDQLHVFGRTAGTPHRYYYRRRVEDRYWTSWESVDLDIGPGARNDIGQGHPDQLIPVTWDARLFLIWPIFTEEAEPQESEPKQRIPKRWRIQLAWSEYKAGKWEPKRISDSTHAHRYTEVSLGRHWFIFKGFTCQTDNGDSTQLVVRCYEFYWESIEGPKNPAYRRLCRFTLRSFNSDFVRENESGSYPIAAPHGALALGMFVHQETSPGLYLPKTADGSASAVALAKAPRGTYRLLYAHQHPAVSGLRIEPWFFNDDLRTYSVFPIPLLLDLTLFNLDPGTSEVTGADWGSGSVLTQRDPFSTIVSSTLPKPVVNPGDPPLFADTVSEPLSVTDDVVASSSASTNAIRSIAAVPLIATWDAAATPEDETSLATAGAYSLQEKGAYPVVSFIASRYDYSYRFCLFYHPYVGRFVEALNLGGVDGLLQRPNQLLSDGKLHPIEKNLFTWDYKPITGPDALVDSSYPIEEVDFSLGGAYSQYNWELFFHAPLLIAESLRRNQRFEDAQRWFHYIFDPTDSSGLPVPDRYWRTKPFYLKTKAEYQSEHIPLLLRALASGGDFEKLKGIDDSTKAELKSSYKELTTAVQDWREDPFKPHLVARMRTTAYQKTVVMKYLDNLIEWGDQLFRRDTMESINEATQLYVLAADILGKRPEEIPPRALPGVHTYDSIEPLLGELSNALVQIEELVPPSALSSTAAQRRPPLPSLTLYFCVPKNEELLAYWDKVADRLFKIRHCMNIEGVERQLPLFEPPINPALLVKAAAAGLDIGSVLADVSAPLPHYRFQVLAQKVTELCGELKSLGGALLAALEKRDAEKLALLRAGQEKALLVLAEDVRKRQVADAEQQIQVLEASREIVLARYSHYQELLVGKGNVPDVPNAPSGSDDKPGSVDIPGASYGDASTLALEGVLMINREKSELENLESARDWSLAASFLKGASMGAFFMPDWKNAPLGLGTIFGGKNVGQALAALANAFDSVALECDYQSKRSGRIAGHIMRAHDWFLQGTTAAKEITHIDQQIIAAHIRKEIAEKELSNHKKQIEHAEKVEKTLRDKFTNEELYRWTVGQVSGVYFQCYQLAYDLAKRAERAFRHELGLPDSSYIQFGYWDSLKKGLLAGERLTQDLKRMEVAYLERNRRELEITKHVSLVQLDPVALIQLRETGKCWFEVPEVLFDLDYPGHYMRRIKAVSLTIPCVTGPFTGVNCTLTLLRSSIRHSSLLTNGKYDGSTDAGDSRFTDSIGLAQSIVTSSGRDDSGLFETNLRDERLLPFEGAGAISRWQLELPSSFKAFDYDTITDVVLHLRYTARAAGGQLKEQAVNELTATINAIVQTGNEQGLARVFSLRHEFPSEWQAFVTLPKSATVGQKQQCTFDTSKERFPYIFQGRAISVGKVRAIIDLDPTANATKVVSALKLTLEAGTAAKSDPCSASGSTPAQGHGIWRVEWTQAPTALGNWTLAACLTAGQAKALKDILIVCHYQVA